MRRTAAAATGFALLLSGCSSMTSREARSPGEELLGALPSLPESPEALRLQVVLGWVEPGADGRQHLRQVTFRAGAEYFYPASSIKFFAAIAALERLAEIRRATGLLVSRDTPLVLHPLFEGEKVEREDPTHLAAPTITVGHEIVKLAVVSDNEAFNRLYELVGQDGLFASMSRAGLPDARIVHRLDELRSSEDNRRYPRTDFVGAGFEHSVPARSSEPLPPPRIDPPGLLVGEAVLRDGARVEGPMDFSGKNRIALVDLQRGLCKLVTPVADCGGGGSFALDEGDRTFLVEALSTLPSESSDPRFDPSEHVDDELKPLLPGLRRIAPRERWRIVDKLGWAYGFMVENAYVEDRGTGRGLFLAATIYVNSDGVLNDDRYEYAGVARPFLADLGEVAGRMLVAASSADQPKNR